VTSTVSRASTVGPLNSLQHLYKQKKNAIKSHFCVDFMYTRQDFIGPYLELFTILYFLSKIMQVPGRSIYTTGPYTKIVTGCANKDK
jgi:hypothetical protein